MQSAYGPSPSRRCPSPHAPTEILRCRGYSGDLVFRADDRDLGIEWLGQRAGGDLGPDPARIAQRDGEPRT